MFWTRQAYERNGGEKEMGWGGLSQQAARPALHSQRQDSMTKTGSPREMGSPAHTMHSLLDGAAPRCHVPQPSHLEAGAAVLRFLCHAPPLCAVQPVPLCHPEVDGLVLLILHCEAPRKGTWSPSHLGQDRSTPAWPRVHPSLIIAYRPSTWLDGLLNTMHAWQALAPPCLAGRHDPWAGPL